LFSERTFWKYVEKEKQEQPRIPGQSHKAKSAAIVRFNQTYQHGAHGFAHFAPN
jgi:hypothetical protein